jgi:thiosulfate/3-mercaptopyruvate sulfurtransferase
VTGPAPPGTSRPSTPTAPPRSPAAACWSTSARPSASAARRIDPVAGHIPGAVNAPLTEITDALGRFLSPDALARHFTEHLTAVGVTPNVPVAAYCGSGVTVCQTLLALRLAGFDEAALYPGSWSGWITDPSRPVATGA